MRWRRFLTTSTTLTLRSRARSCVRQHKSYPYVSQLWNHTTCVEVRRAPNHQPHGSACAVQEFKKATTRPCCLCTGSQHWAALREQHVTRLTPRCVQKEGGRTLHAPRSRMPRCRQPDSSHSSSRSRRYTSHASGQTDTPGRRDTCIQDGYRKPPHDWKRVRSRP